MHSDLCSPVSEANTLRYVLTFTDDYLRYTWTYLLAHKSDTYQTFTKFCALVERNLFQPIKVLRTDRGGEYLSDLFKQYCAQASIHRQLTTARTPHQNGVAERKNRKILEAARAIFIAGKFLALLWHECVSAATYVLNRCGNRALILKTPFEALRGSKPHLAHL